MSLRSGALFLLLATFVPAPAGAQERLTLERAVAEALAGNPSVQAARAGTGEAAAHVDGARAAFFPRVSFSESWQRGNQPVFVFSSLLSARRFAAPNFAIDALNHPDASGFFHAAFGVEQLLFDGGRSRASVQTAELGRDTAQASTRQVEADVMLHTTEAYGRVLTAEAARRAAEAAVEAAREDLARGERRRDVGTVNDADVLSLSVHLSSMQQRAIEAAGHESVARAELNQWLGAPIEREFQAVEPPIVVNETQDLTSLIAAAEASRPELQRSTAARQLAAAATRQARAAFLPQVAAQANYQADGLSFSDRMSAWLVGGELRWTLSLGGAERARQRAAAEGLKRAEAELEASRNSVRLDVVSALRRLEAARARQSVAASAVAQARESQRIIRDRFEAGLAATPDVLRAASTLLDAEAQRVSAIVDAAVSDAMLRRAIGRIP